MKLRIAITGANGFIAKKIVKKLLNSDDVFLHLSSSCEEYLSLNENHSKLFLTPNIFLENDFFLNSFLRNIDVVINCAWYTEPGKYLDSSYNLDCLIGSLRLAKIAKENNVKKFISIGSCFEYDLNHKYLSVSSPLLEKNIYSATKISLYKTLSFFFENSNCLFVWPRIFFVYGENEKNNRLHTILKNNLINDLPILLKNPYAVRDYVEVGEAANQIIMNVYNDFKGPINICSGAGTRVIDIANSIAKEYNKMHLIKLDEFHNLNSNDIIIGVK